MGMGWEMLTSAEAGSLVQAPLLWKNAETHIWRVALDLAPETLTASGELPPEEAPVVAGTQPLPYSHLAALLSPDEQARAARFYFERDRSRFIVAHAALRSILSGYLGIAATDLQFETNQYGKPSLHPDLGGRAASLQFNLAHSHNLALIALSPGWPVGVDVEWMRRLGAAADLAAEDQSTWKIAEYYFSPQEVTALHRLPPTSRSQGFFNCWTRKEAFIKARGMGLSIPLNSFDVTLAPGEKARLLDDRLDPDGAGRWQMHAFEAGQGYASAVCAAGPLDGLRFLHWDFR